MKQSPTPPRPEFVRAPKGPFGWLDAHLLHEHWLARLGTDATAVLLLLALAADRRGASFFSRARMATALDLDGPRVDAALERLLRWKLVALRPWRSGRRDGVWQLLPVESQRAPRSNRTMNAAQVLERLGLGPRTTPNAD